MADKLPDVPGGRTCGRWRCHATETWARGRGRKPEKVTEGVFTFVAIDGQGRPRELPEDDGG